MEALKTHIKDHYDALAGSYERRWQAYNQCQIDWVMAHWPDDTGQEFSVLDLGCGTGLMLAAIKRRFPKAKLIGVDGSSGMLDQARRNLLEATFLEGDIENADFTASLPKADIVLSLSVLHHLKDVQGHLRLLGNKGGTVFLSDFTRTGIKLTLADCYFRLTQNFHTKTLSPSDLAKEVKRAFPAASTQNDILRPDRFWRIAIYKIERT